MKVFDVTHRFHSLERAKSYAEVWGTILAEVDGKLWRVYPDGGVETIAPEHRGG